MQRQAPPCSLDAPQIAALLRARLPAGSRAYLFGSRLSGTARPGADWDVAIDAPQALSPGAIAQLKDQLEDLSGFERVDLVDLAIATERFRDLVIRTGRPLW